MAQWRADPFGYSVIPAIVIGSLLASHTLLNAVFVLMLVTSILGPVLTERFAPRMIEHTTSVVGRDPAIF